MPKFRPHLKLDLINRSYSIEYPTYKELKRQLKGLLTNSNEIFVTRSRRGEWGEWYEYWKLDDNGKPYIDREGWM